MAKTIKKMKKNKELLILGLILLLALGLRVYKIAEVPPSLFGDEVDTGYQAYSILKTGRDYFGKKWPIHFQSYGDWRMPLYIYLLAPSIHFLGLNELAVRLPAAIFGTLGVLMAFLLAKKITNDEKVALVAAFLLSISPWHLQFSRGAFEAILLTVFYPLGIILFLEGIKKGTSQKWLVFSALIFGLTPYTYNTPKLFLPLISLVLLLLYRQELFAQKKKFVLFILTLFLILIPLVRDTFSGPGSARFASISIFNNQTTAEKVRLARQNCPYDGVLEKMLHNKVTFWIKDFVVNYLQPYSLDFLFISGDPNPRHSSGRGELYLFELPFLLIGLVLLISQLKKGNELFLFILFWLILTPLPAALTQNGGTHAIRLIQFLPWFQILIAMGLIHFYQSIREKKFRLFFLFLLIPIVACSLFLYLHYYYYHYPKIEGRWWNYGYREIFEYINKNFNQFQKIYISSGWEPPVVYTLFYTKYDPNLAQKELTISPYTLGKFVFQQLESPPEGEKILYVATPGLGVENWKDYEKIKTIEDPAGQEIFYLYCKK